MNKPTTARPSKGVRGRATARGRPRRRTLAVGGAVAVAILVTVGIMASGGDDNQGQVPTAEAAAEGMAFEMLDGSTAALADYRGQPLVVNFFASWCVPCLAEMPGFERVHQDLDGQVAFLGINLQDRAEDGRRVVEQTGVTYDIARDPDGSIFQTFGAFAMPTTVFIDADGTVVDLHSGEISASALADRIDELLLA